MKTMGIRMPFFLKMKVVLFLLIYGVLVYANN